MNKLKHLYQKCKYGYAALFGFVLPCLTFSQNNYLTKAKLYYVLDSNIYYGEKHLQQCLNNSIDSKTLIDAYRYVISNYLNKEKFTKARSLTKQMLELATKKNYNEMQFVAIGLFGDIEKYEKNYSMAIGYYLKSYDLLEKNKYWHYLFKCAIDIVEFNRAVAKYNDAEIYIRKAFKIYNEHQLTDSVMLARLYNRIAAVKNETGTMALIDSSIIYSKKALLINQKLKNLNAQAITYNELGYSYRHLKQIDTAEAFFIKAEQIWFHLGADNSAINAINNRAALYGYYNYKPDERIGLYFKILEVIKQRKVDFDIHLVYKGLSEAYFRNKDINKALYYFQLYHDAYDKKLEKIYSAQIDEIKEKHESDKIRAEVKQVAGKLNLSEQLLVKQKFENKLMYTTLFVFGTLITIIVILFFKVNKNNVLLKSKNAEKDILIQEIHHRVKNNLQFVSSLLNMQTNSSNSDKDVHALTDASRRVRAMALVHEMLYNQNELNGVDIKKYLEELTKSINDLVNSNNLPVLFKLDIEKHFFDTNTSIALGMITSELVSNSIKYAFLNKTNGQILITLKKHNDNFEFIVKDDGVGLNPNSNTSNKLGMRLIDIFSRQLKGKHQISNNNGVEYKLDFN